jgi:hypothetical protein
MLTTQHFWKRFVFRLGGGAGVLLVAAGFAAVQAAAQQGKTPVQTEPQGEEPPALSVGKGYRYSPAGRSDPFVNPNPGPNPDIPAADIAAKAAGKAAKDAYLGAEKAARSAAAAIEHAKATESARADARNAAKAALDTIPPEAEKPVADVLKASETADKAVETAFRAAEAARKSSADAAKASKEAAQFAGEAERAAAFGSALSPRD